MAASIYRGCVGGHRVGATGTDDNATFSEEDGFCVNEQQGCD
ncbi:MAG: hypothetical protein ACOZNI_26230 [Myxococcota bacterium]